MPVVSETETQKQVFDTYGKSLEDLTQDQAAELSTTSSKQPDLEIFQQDTIPTYPQQGGSEIGGKAQALEGPRSLSTPNFPKIVNLYTEKIT